MSLPVRLNPAAILPTLVGVRKPRLRKPVPVKTLTTRQRHERDDMLRVLDIAGFDRVCIARHMGIGERQILNILGPNSAR